MGILFLMILVSVSLGVIFLTIFVISAKKGQFDDDKSPAVRMLFDDSLSGQENKSE
ncbi:MAG: cbb3-type cytochrome oxidase assembly protein CcoS [Flavobacteriales bacterium Tduv]